MTFYIGVVDRGGEGYGVWFPDLPGCTSAGRTMDDLFRMGIEAVALWLEDAVAHGELPPSPRGLAEIRKDGDVIAALREDADVTFVQIPVLLEERRSTTANISLDVGALRAIDAAAAQRGMTRSAFMTGAAIEKLSSITSGTENKNKVARRNPTRPARRA